jgi:hypothetical protein
MFELAHSSEIILIFKIRVVLSIKTCLEGGNLVNLTIQAPWCIMGWPSNIFYQTTCKGQTWEAAKALFCRNIMEACKPREHGSNSKQKHHVEGAIMQAKEWTRTSGRCTRSRSNKASMSALEKNRAKRRREVSLPSICLFVCSSL